MSDNIVNLRKFRKQDARRQAEGLAERNRAKFGQPKAQSRLEKARREQAAKRLDGHQLQGAGSPDGQDQDA